MVAQVPVRCAACGNELAVGRAACSQCGQARPLASPVPRGHRYWWRVLLGGAALYWITLRLLASSGNPNLAPTVILLGAFTIPVAYVVYLYESDALFDMPAPIIALTFFYGGVLGLILAQFLEERLVLNMGFIGMLGVGVSEELAKPLGVLWLARRQEYVTARHGFLLGAAAGMGFAAFETMGYGFTFLIISGGDLDVLGEVLLTRGLLSPMAHAAWTALVVGVFWREGRRLNRAVLGAFLTAVLLHALWDWTAGLVPIALPIPGLELQWRFIDLSIPSLSLPVPGLIIGAIGLWTVRRASRVRAPAPQTA
jgi:RsiW-degrading membrane proteinase PrsW (M82 family)